MNKKIYRQADSRWGSLPYPTKQYSFAGNGCGCCACLHVIIELEKYKNWTPKELRPYMVDQGFATKGHGTTWSGITKTLQHYGFKVINHGTMAGIFATLDARKKNGQMCIGVILFRSGTKGGITWTAGGHYVAFVDYKTVNGRHYFYTKDSGGRHHDGWYCYETQMKGLIPQIWSAISADKAASDTPGKREETLKKLTADGIGGEQTVIAMQRFLKTFEDGIISGQNKSLNKFYTGLTSVAYGRGGSTCIKALQKWLNLSDPDGIIGSNTTKAWQKRLRDLGYLAKEEKIDGYFGPKSMKAWQKFLNDQLFKDGKEESPKQETKQEPKKEEPTTAKTDDLVIDVSYIQNSIDWAKAKAAGVKGAIIRCGYRGYESGKLCQDDMFMSHIKGAHKAGLKVGVYFFTEGINAAEGKEEAAYTLNLVKKAGIPLSYPIAIDTEHINASGVRANNLSKAKRTEVIKAFCTEIKRQGYEPMIYASLNWFENNLDMSKLPYKVWCAQYYKKCQYKGDYVMWQYTSEGKINGIKGVVDLNHCYIAGDTSTPSGEAGSTASKSTTAAVSNVAALSIEELAKQVISGKWGSGQERKEKLTKAGYDYDMVQEKVNQLLADTVATREEVIAKGNAWARKICADNRYHYNMWEQNDPQSHKCPICSKLKYEDNPDDFGWNCIGLTAAIWRHGFGLPCRCSCGWITGPGGTGDKLLAVKTDAEALKLAKKYTGLDDIKIIRSKNGIPKKQWQPGDICLEFNGEVFKHAFYYPGGTTVIDSTRIYNDKKKWTDAVKAKQIAERSYKNYSAKVIIRWTGGEKTEKKSEKKAYTGTLPSTKLVKTNAEVKADTIKFLKWIAGDNDFHYGHGDAAHHNGCYFCKTQPKVKKKAGIVDYEHTYCCNPLIGAGWAHGGCVPKAMELCKKGSSWDFGKGKGYDKSSLFANLGHPDKSKLEPGDVLCKDTHVALYVGGGKIVEASSGDDNVKGSKKWNNSIHITALTDKRYAGFKRVHRFKGSVNTVCCMYHGEVSKRVELLQAALKYLGYGISADGYFGDVTLKAVEKFQKKAGVTVDGIVGPNTITALRKAVK